jgi:hypothetical protein
VRRWGTIHFRDSRRKTRRRGYHPIHRHSANPTTQARQIAVDRNVYRAIRGLGKIVNGAEIRLRRRPILSKKVGWTTTSKCVRNQANSANLSPFSTIAKI